MISRAAPGGDQAATRSSSCRCEPGGHRHRPSARASVSSIGIVSRSTGAPTRTAAINSVRWCGWDRRSRRSEVLADGAARKWAARARRQRHRGLHAVVRSQLRRRHRALERLVVRRVLVDPHPGTRTARARTKRGRKEARAKFERRRGIAGRSRRARHRAVSVRP